MSEYNAKNYTEQGGEITHIGGKLIIEEGASVEGLPNGDGSYALPPATESVLGGIKVGSGLSVLADGTLSANGITPMENQTNSEATTIVALKDNFNALLTKLKSVGFMEADN